MFDELQREQAGIVTRAQVLSCGLTRRHIDGMLTTGRWRRIHTGVYATFSGPLPRLAQLWAGVLRAGAGAVLSHETAAELWGLTDGPSRRIHVMVPGDRSPVPIVGVVVHRSARAGESRHPTRTPPRTRLDETIIDLAQSARSVDDAIAWVARAVGGPRRTASASSWVDARRSAGAAFSMPRWPTSRRAATH